MSSGKYGSVSNGVGTDSIYYGRYIQRENMWKTREYKRNADVEGTES